jgi:hypothetical protein
MRIDEQPGNLSLEFDAFKWTTNSKRSEATGSVCLFLGWKWNEAAALSNGTLSSTT